MGKKDKTSKELMIEIFGGIDGGMYFAREWAKISCKLNPTPENVEKQQEALKEMESQAYEWKIL